MFVIVLEVFFDAWWSFILFRSWWEYCRVIFGVDFSRFRFDCLVFLEIVGDGFVLKWFMTFGSLGFCDMDVESYGFLLVFFWLLFVV